MMMMRILSISCVLTVCRDVAGLWHEDLDDPSYRHRVSFGR